MYIQCVYTYTVCIGRYTHNNTYHKDQVLWTEVNKLLSRLNHFYAKNGDHLTKHTFFFSIQVCHRVLEET